MFLYDYDDQAPRNTRLTTKENQNGAISKIFALNEVVDIPT